MKRIRGAEKQKAEFLKAMDKTYFSIKKLRDIIEIEEPPPTATPTPLKNDQCSLEKRPTPARTRPTPARINQDPPCNMILKKKEKQSKPTPPSPLHQKTPAWKVELSKTMKQKKKTEKSLQTSKKLDGVQAARFKSFFTSKDVKMTNYHEKTDFKPKCPPVQKGGAEPNSSKISNVGSLRKMFEKKVPGNIDQSE